MALTLAAAGATGLLSNPPGVGASTRAAASPPTITRSAHISYLNCPAPGVLLTGSIQRRPFTAGQRVTYKVSIHNRSHVTCGSPAATTAPTNSPVPPADLLGPCSEVSALVENSRGSVVYPQEGIACPVILGPSLAAGQTITVTGTWVPSAGYDGIARPGFAPGVPAGEYRIVIDGKVTLPVELSGPPFVSPPATLPPRLNPLPTPSAPAQPLPNLPAPTAPSPLPSTTTPTTGTVPTTPTAPSLPGHPVTRSAHVAFDGCSAKAITFTVTIPAGSTPSAPVRYIVAVHNGGTTACGRAFRNNPPFARQFRVGICSAVPVVVSNAFGVDVYPGPQVYMCPMFAGPYIAPHTTVSASGTWPGTEFVASSAGGVRQQRPASPGPYTLDVDSAVQVPFTLATAP
jgi:hypothetical protein